jgi:hypothetical protein
MKKTLTREATDLTLQEREEAWERFQKTADYQKRRQEHASRSSVRSKADKELLLNTIACGILNRSFRVRLERARDGEVHTDTDVSAFTVILPVLERDKNGKEYVEHVEAEPLEVDRRILNQVKSGGRIVPLESTIPFAALTTEDRKYLKQKFPVFKETEAQDFFALQFAQEESWEAFHRGDVAPLIRHLRAYGPLLFFDLADEGLNNLPWALVELYSRALFGDLTADRNYTALLKALGKKWRGRRRRLGLAEHEQVTRRNKQKSNLDSQQLRRARLYCDRLWGEYVSQTANVTDVQVLRDKALALIREACARGGAAKKEGVRLFQGHVKQALTDRTVRKN